MTFAFLESSKYNKDDVQFLNISTSFGQWYVTAYNYDNDKMQVFRCDKILSLSINENKEPVDNYRIETLKKIISRKRILLILK